MRSWERTGSRGIISSRGMKPFGIGAEIDVHAIAVHPLDDSADERPRPILVRIDHLGTLGLAHLLHDDLFGRLREDAAEGNRLHRLLDEPARLHVLVDVARIVHPQFALGDLQFGGVVGEHLPAPERVVGAGLAVDGDPHVEFLAVFLARRGGQRRLQSVEDDFLVDALLVGHRIDRHQYFFVHKLHRTPRHSGRNLAF